VSAAIGRIRALTIGAGGVAAMFGLYWDDAWHTDVGRDTFFAPPHLLLYSGVGVLFLVLAAMTWQRYRSAGIAVVRDPAYMLPLGGAAVTVAAAPLDELWHQLFGRDAVTWSPPHMVAIAGMAAFAAGLVLLVTRPRTRSSHMVTVAIGAFLIAAMTTVVMEFETDVPQFGIVWYLPVSTAALTFAFGLIDRATTRPWLATQAAAAYLVLRVGVIGFLGLLGHSLPTVMPTVVAAWAFELARNRDLPRWAIAALTTVATVGSHVTAHAVQPAGLTFTPQDIAAGASMGFAAAWAVLSVIGTGRPRPAAVPMAAGRATMLGLAVAGMVTAGAAPALAHDPGQGDDVAAVVLDARRQENRIDLEIAAPAGSCQRWEPLQVVARRAGKELVAPLTSLDGCRFAGTVTVDDPGRWFIYAEVAIDGRLAEAWVPIVQDPVRKETVLYVAGGNDVHVIQVVAGAALYLLVFGIFGAVVVAYRRAPGRYLFPAVPAVVAPVPRKV
jgi:hypothetical protein